MILNNSWEFHGQAYSNATSSSSTHDYTPVKKQTEDKKFHKPARATFFLPLALYAKHPCWNSLKNS